MSDQNIEITIKDGTGSGGAGSSGKGTTAAKTPATPADMAKVLGKSLMSGHGIMGGLKEIGKISAGVALGMTIFSTIGKGISFIVNLFRKSRIFSSFFNAFMDVIMAVVDLMLVPLIPILSSVLTTLLGWLEAYQEGGFSGLFDQIIDDALSFIGNLPKYIWGVISKVDLGTVLKGLIVGVALMALLTPLIVGVTLLALLGPLIIGITLMALFSKFITGVSLMTLFSPFVTGAAGITAAATGLITKLGAAVLAVGVFAGTLAAIRAISPETFDEGASAIGGAVRVDDWGDVATGILAGPIGLIGKNLAEDLGEILDVSVTDAEANRGWQGTDTGKIYGAVEEFRKAGSFFGGVLTGGITLSQEQATAIYRRLIGQNYDANSLPSNFQEIANKIMGTSGQQYRLGTNYVPGDMLAMLHKGERVTPAVQNTFNQNFSYSGSESAFLASRSMASGFNDNIRTILMRR